jgi:hypothetical protein
VLDQTLRAHLPSEQQKRQARARLEDRLRRSAPFQELRHYAEAVLKRDLAGLTRGQDRALARLFEEFGFTGAGEQAAVRSRLRDGPTEVRALLTRKQAEVKRAFRAAQAVESAQLALFDELVDEEVNRLLTGLDRKP